MRVGKTAEPCLSFWYNSCISAPGIYGSFLISIKKIWLRNMWIKRQAVCRKGLSFLFKLRFLINVLLKACFSIFLAFRLILRARHGWYFQKCNS